MTHMTHHSNSLDNILVLGATGKTGKRIAERLRSIGKNVRSGSRSAQPAFDWNHENGWDACLEGMDAVYINYAPDLAISGASDSIQSFVNKAKDHGIRKLVLLSGRGEEEAQACERIDYLFNTVLDGRNAYLSEGIQQALGRPPKDFSDFASEVASKGTWNLT